MTMINVRSLIISVAGILLLQSARANTYYFSTSQGNDNYSTVQARNPNTPWNSVSKLNSIMNALLPGDSILFKRGDVFYGTITITVSGHAGKPITFGAYGPGSAQPILDGRIKLTKWTRNGNNIWISSDPNLTSMPSALTLDGNLQALGRYPNLDAPNGGYLTISSHPAGSATQFTCNSLDAKTDFTNAEVVARTTHWTIDRCQATQSGTTITVNPALDHEAKDGYGFFFQNHPAALDKNGEWCYVNGIVSLYLNSDPGLRDVEVANTNYCITAQQGKANITIDGLEIIGAKLAAISANGCTNFIVQNCTILDSGTDGIDMPQGNGNSVLNNTVRWSQNTGILADGNNTLIYGNRVSQTAMLTGMALSGARDYGISTNSGTTVKMNYVDSTGYDGIIFRGNNVTIVNNVINHFCAVTDDGGGIYTYAVPSDKLTNRILAGNLIMNGVSAPNGTNSNTYVPANGIYMDGSSPNVSIINNTIANCAQFGLDINNTSLTIRNNLVYNCAVSLAIFNGKDNKPNIKQNTFVKLDPDHYLPGYFNSISTTDLTTFGVIDSNLYCRPFFEFGDDYIKYYVTGSTNAPLQNFLNLPGWQRNNGNIIDKNSSVSLPKISLFKQVNNSNMLQNTTFDSNVNGWSKQDDIGNTSNLIWGAGQLDGGSLAFTVVGAGESRIISKLNSPVIAGRMYRLKMSVKSTGTGNIGVQLRLNGSPYTPGSVLHNIPVSGPGRQEVELIIRADSNLATPYLFLSFDQNLSSVYIDNVELVEVSINDPSQFLRFVVNRSFSDSTITLDGDYFTPSGVSYSKGASIRIPATSGIILLANTNASLSGLVLSNGTLSPAFASGTTNYTAKVSSGTANITLSPTTTYNSVITINGKIVPSGTASGNIPLNVGNNTVTIVVTALNGTTKTYTVTIMRPSNNVALSDLLISAGTLSPVFTPAVNNYTDSVTSNTTDIMLTATAADSNAVVMINGVAANTGTTSADISLNIGSNAIVVTITAQDGTTTQTYAVNVNRAFTLPATNFTVNVSGDTCSGIVDGSILVTAAANNSYTAVLSGAGINATQKFTTSSTFSNLPSGSYALTITVDGQPAYKYFQTVVITQSNPLSVVAAVNYTTGNLDLAFSGGATYHITLNGNTYTTAQTNFSVPFLPGSNVLKVTTDKGCQGIFTRLFNLSPNVVLYPLPFKDILNLHWLSGNGATVGIKIYSATGVLVYSAEYQNSFAPLQMDLSRLAKGVYGLYLKLNDDRRQFKIIKQ